MANPYYSAYLNDVLTLCKTLVVKFDMAATAINKELSVSGHDVSSLPENWKYYMNLAGEYHLTDKMMYITSLDTLEVIEFTKVNLMNHRATAKAYYNGSRYFNTLVTEYPSQKSLIVGIVSPVDKSKAISSETGTVLHYDSKLVEYQESTLIHQMETWIKVGINRWYNTGYAITDEYFPSVIIGNIFANLPHHILNLRLKARGTNEVHSFHIQMRLASHGRLHRFLPQMTLKQKLFLYRNIKYINNNVGKNETFELLLKNIITERNLPLARYDMYHTLVNVPEEILPEVEFRRVNLNDHPGDGGDPSKSLQQLMIKQEGQARSNYDVQINSQDVIYNSFKHSKSDRLKTKVLESALLDTTNSVVYSMEDILLNHWGYMVGTGLFTMFLTASNPYNGEKYQLQAKEAFILYLYLYYKARGVTFDTTPIFTAINVVKRNLPSIDTLYEEFKGYLTRDDILDIAGNIPAVVEKISLYPFQKFIEEVYRFKNKQVNVISQTEEIETRAVRDLVSTRFYEDIELDMYNGADMDVWLADRDIDISDLSLVDLDTMATSILFTLSEGVLGKTSNSLQDIQSSMLGIMRQLSSYSVQYIKTINDSNFKIGNILSIRGGNSKSSIRGFEHVTVSDIGCNDLKLKVKILADVDFKPSMKERIDSITADKSASIELGLDFNVSTSVKIKYLKANIGEMSYNEMT